MIVYFCRSRKPGSYIIRAALFSQWSHVAIEINGTVFDATAFNGVKAWQPDEFRARHSEVKAVQLGGLDERKALEFIWRQVGKGYDWRALIALPLRSNWQRPDKWFCSELVAVALERAGHEMRIDSHRVTPRDLWAAL